ncbi:MAG: ATP-dependent helicase, partial [Actinomycetes bacterium]
MTQRAGSTMTVDRLCQIVGYRLSDEQLAAVTADLDQPLRIVAGAGSGKTSVMAARVVWAVGCGHVRPGEVLGLTFTTKAAAELGARIRRMLGCLQDGADDELGEPLVTTYHSFAHQLVGEQGLRIGVEPGARLLADNETALLAYRVLATTDLPLAGLASGPAALVPDVVALDQQLAEHVVSTQALRDHDRRIIETIDALPKSVAADRRAREAAVLRMQLANAVDELRASKAAADVVDFADLLRFGVQVAELAEVAAMERARWPMVLLDEYQDTSVVQARMLAGLFGGGHPVTAVGDPLQGIYGWRGASADGMDAFAVSFSRTDGDPARTCQLSISHRSGPRILDNANRVAAPLRDAHPAVAKLQPAVLDDGGTRRDGVVAALFTTYQQEVEWLADRVADQIHAGTEAGQIAILCRTSTSFAELADALDARGIPSQVSTLDGLFAQPEVIDILSVLQVLHDPSANPPALRILLGPRWRIGKRDLAILGRRSADIVRFGGGRRQPAEDTIATVEQRLSDALEGNDPVDIGSLIEAVEDPGDQDRYRYSASARTRFRELTAELDGLRSIIGQPLADVVSRVVGVLGLDVEVELAARQAVQTPRGAGRVRGIAALSTFMQLVAGFADIDGDTSLGGFLAWIKLVERFGGEPTVDATPSPTAVQILTVHKAKGLEWDVVFTPFMSNQVFPTARPRPRWTVAHGELPHRLRGDRAALPDLAGFGTKNHELFAEQMKDHSEAEERRLA